MNTILLFHVSPVMKSYTETAQRRFICNCYTNHSQSPVAWKSSNDEVIVKTTENDFIHDIRYMVSHNTFI